MVRTIRVVIKKLKIVILIQKRRYHKKLQLKCLKIKKSEKIDG